MVGEITGGIDVVKRGEPGIPGLVQCLNGSVFVSHGIAEGVAADRMSIVVTHFVEQFVTEYRIVLCIAHPGFVKFPVQRNSERMVWIKCDKMPAAGGIFEIRIVGKMVDFRRFVFLPEIDFIGEETVYHRFEPRIGRQLQALHTVRAFFQSVTGEDEFGIVGADVDAEQAEPPDRSFHVKLPSAGDKCRLSVAEKHVVLNRKVLNARIKMMLFLPWRHFDFDDQIFRKQGCRSADQCCGKQKRPAVFHNLVLSVFIVCLITFRHCAGPCRTAHEQRWLDDSLNGGMARHSSLGQQNINGGNDLFPERLTHDRERKTESL